MLGIERRRKIINLIKEKGNVTISEVVSLFNISAETARKDLLNLEQSGALIRTHGGAISKNKHVLLPPLHVRKQNNAVEKAELCRYAMRFIENDDIIAIDEGSTAFELAKLIVSTIDRLKVVTHSLEIFDILSGNSGIDTILCGGNFIREEAAFAGFLTIGMIRQIHTKKVFLFPSGISLKYGITDYTKELLEVQTAYINTSDHVFVLADNEKFEKGAFLKICDTSDQYTYITDSKLSDDIYNRYQEKNIIIVRG